MNYLEQIIKVDKTGKWDFTKYQFKLMDEFFDKLRDKKVIMKLSLYKSKRTLLENNYYHKINKILDDFTGQGVEWFDIFNKKKFFTELEGVDIKVNTKQIEGEKIAVRVLVIDGEEKKFSSTSLDAVRFYQWLELIREFWNDKFKEFDFYIQTPEEYLQGLER